MSRWEAVIVGGGPGGSTAAWRLAGAGRRVLVIEAREFPRVKLCAGWVTKRCLADLEIDPAAYPHTIQAIDTVLVGYGEKLKKTSWPEPASFGIVRKEFDHYLLRRAEAAGAEVREGVRVRAVEAEASGVRLDIGGEWIEAEMVVGAGGYTCPVARALGGISSEEVVVLTRESETEVGAGRLRSATPHFGRPELFAEPDFRGYGWYFTKGDFMNIGVGCVGKKPSVHERLGALMRRLRRSGRLPEGVELTPFKGHAYAIRRGKARLPAGERFVLVGDAAGLAQDFSGEGIGPAVRSARLAAEEILAWLEGRSELAAYVGRLSEIYGSGGGGVAVRLADALPESLIRSAAKMICANAWLRRRVVLEGAFGMG
jgi:geranylgeranyl reductase family protein